VDGGKRRGDSSVKSKSLDKEINCKREGKDNCLIHPLSEYSYYLIDSQGGNKKLGKAKVKSVKSRNPQHSGPRDRRYWMNLRTKKRRRIENGEGESQFG